MNRHHQLLEKQFKLSVEQIHVFLFKLDLFDHNEFVSYLSDDECERADRLKIEEKKKQFVIARAVLRKLLANCLSLNVREITFSYGEHCKPYVIQKYNHHVIEFNLSHSGNYVLMALTLDNKVGVDIEKVNEQIDYQSLSRRFFSEKEKQELGKLAQTEQLEAFYRAWVRKESFIKAVGRGIAYGLDRFSVSLGHSKISRIDIEPNNLDNEKWYCYDLVSVENYKTALTSSNDNVEIILFDQ